MKGETEKNNSIGVGDRRFYFRQLTAFTHALCKCSDLLSHISKQRRAAFSKTYFGATSMLPWQSAHNTIRPMHN